MTNVSHLRALQALELTIRTGSLKAAAAELSISPAAIGQRIRALEDYLGFDLLVRGRSGTRPTKELEAVVAHLSAGFRELETVTRILDFQRVNEIHIEADTDWAELWLKPRLDAYRENNSGTLFCVNGVGDVPARTGEPDCNIWFGDQRSDKSGDLLFRDYLLPVSSPVNRVRILKKPRDEMLEEFPLLHLDCYAADGGGLGWSDWIGRYGYRKTPAGQGIRYKKVVHALEAVYADAGCIVCGLALLQSRIEDGRLETLFPLAEGAWSMHAYRAAFSPESMRREQVIRFREWLLEQARQTCADIDAMLKSTTP